MTARLTRLMIIGCALALQSCTTKTIQHVVPVTVAPASEFVAGAGKAEITPPAGYPFFGYSLESKSLARGFQSRLYARAFYLESAGGEAVALVQCDLGAISGMLHHDVARRVSQTTGLGPDRILIAATHTHSAPGAYFGSSLYNDFGSKEVGFDEGLFDYLSEQIAAAIDSAYVHRGKAVAAVGTCEIDGITYNRSLAACLANFPELQQSEPDDVLHAVNKTFTMLRIDQVSSDGTVPLGAFTNFAIHGTCIGGDNDLYNGDCHAAAERYLEEAIRNTPEGRRSSVIVHAITNGMEGDVAPKFDRTRRGFNEAERIGRVIADSAFALYRSLKNSLTADFTIQRAYREISMRHSTHSDSAELALATSGFPVMGGTEDGYTPMHYFWPGAEGSRAKSADLTIGPVGISALLGPFSWRGQDSAKIPGAGGLHDYILTPEAFPRLITLQAIRLGDLLLLTVPGEMTTEMGRRIVERCESYARDSLGTSHTMIVTLANQYMSYITTPEEYSAQHYEGAHTLWGAQMGGFVRDQLAGLIREIPSTEAYDHPDAWTFSPGCRAKFAKFEFPAPSPVGVDTVFIDTTLGGQKIARYYWWDEKPGELDLRRLDWRIEVPDGDGNWETLRLPGLGGGRTMSIDSKGLDLTVYCCRKKEAKRVTEWMESHRIAEPSSKDLWCVEWKVADSVSPDGFRFALYQGTSDSPSLAAIHLPFSESW